MRQKAESLLGDTLELDGSLEGVRDRTSYLFRRLEDFAESTRAAELAEEAAYLVIDVPGSPSPYSIPADL